MEIQKSNLTEAADKQEVDVLKSVVKELETEMMLVQPLVLVTRPSGNTQLTPFTGMGFLN